ncbi:hypothetical protein [Embleya sp. NPDC001921]
MANASTSGIGPQPAGLAQGTITTVVGGSQGPAQKIPVYMGFPARPAMDGSGNLSWADMTKHRVYRVDPQGIVAAVAGNGTPGGAAPGGSAVAAQLNYPAGVAVDADGTVYIAEQFNHVVRKVSTAGVISGVDAPGIKGPSDVAVDTDGNLYIAEYARHCISKVDTKGVFTTIAGNGNGGHTDDGKPATAIASPFCIAVDGGKNLYIVEYGSHRVRRIDPDGVITTVAGNGTAGYAGDGGPATSAQLNFPADVTVDDAGNLFIADSYNHRRFARWARRVSSPRSRAPARAGTRATAGPRRRPSSTAPTGSPWTGPGTSTSRIRATTASAG